MIASASSGRPLRSIRVPKKVHARKVASAKMSSGRSLRGSVQTLPSARSALNRPLNRLLTQLRSNGFRSAPTDSLAIPIQCTRRDLNPHALRRRNLNPVGMYRDAARCSERRISPGSSLHLAAFRYSPWTIQRRFTGLRGRLGRRDRPTPWLLGRCVSVAWMFDAADAAGDDSDKSPGPSVQIPSYDPTCGSSRGAR